MIITDSVKYIGVNDRDIDLFEGMYEVPEGISYNSYLVEGEKIAVMDTVDARKKDEWFKNLEDALGGKKPDYLVVLHMEPDHSANIKEFADRYPDAKIVSSAKSFVMMKNFFGTDFKDKQVVMKEGDTLDLGGRSLKFIEAPMVHWPEVIVAYDTLDKILFSADGFGKFGALDTEDEWACEARRYYIGIVGKYGAQVQSLLRKAATLDIRKICPLHGPVLSENLEYYINLYDIWSSYSVESEGVVIAYTSVYGNTKKAALKLADLLKEKGCKKVVVNDLARCDMAEAVEDAFRYGKIVLATTTYNGGVFPFMREFINNLIERGYKNREIGIIENSSWAPMAAKKIKSAFEKSVNITFLEPEVKIMSALSADSENQLEKLATELCK